MKWKLISSILALKRSLTQTLLRYLAHGNWQCHYFHKALSSSQWVDQFVVFWDLGSVLTHRSLNWNEVENPMCLKLAVTAPLIYHRGWEARGKPGKRRLSTSTKATSVTLSYCLGEWLSPRRAPSRKFDLQKWLWVPNLGIAEERKTS